MRPRTRIETLQTQKSLWRFDPSSSLFMSNLAESCELPVNKPNYFIVIQLAEEYRHKVVTFQFWFPEIQNCLLYFEPLES